ncbi:MAG: hypothetical protein IKC90_06260 [Akkermansia sp.]|nr:hypothetical protein [Akkermansia sp.]
MKLSVISLALIFAGSVTSAAVPVPKNGVTVEIWNQVKGDKVADLTTVAEKILAGAAANNARPDDRSVALIRVTERTAG